MAEMLAGRGGETGTPEPLCWLAAACLGLLCAALFLGITSLGIHCELPHSIAPDYPSVTLWSYPK